LLRKLLFHVVKMAFRAMISFFRGIFGTMSQTI